MAASSTIHLDAPHREPDGTYVFAASGVTEDGGLWDGIAAYDPSHDMYKTIEWLFLNRKYFHTFMKDEECKRLHEFLQDLQRNGSPVRGENLRTTGIGLIDDDDLLIEVYNEITSILKQYRGYKIKGGFEFGSNIFRIIDEHTWQLSIHAGFLRKFQMDFAGPPQHPPTLKVFQYTLFGQRELASIQFSPHSFRTDAAKSVALLGLPKK